MERTFAENASKLKNAVSFLVKLLLLVNSPVLQILKRGFALKLSLRTLKVLHQTQSKEYQFNQHQNAKVMEAKAAKSISN